MSALNSKPVLQQNIQDGKLKLWRILLILPLRLVLAVVFQALTSIIFKLLNDPTPWQSAGEWWIVYGTLIVVPMFTIQHIALPLQLGSQALL